MPTIRNSTSATGTVILAGIMLLITGAIMLYLGFFVTTAVETPMRSILDPSTATGTLTLSGNVSNGELVNITDGTNVYRFEFNTTNNGTTIVCRTTNCISVNLTGIAGTGQNTPPILYNQSWLASGNLTAAMNANVSVSVLVTAVNTTNTTVITAVSTGSSYNSIALSENGASIAWSSTTMTGGVDGEPAYATTKNSVNTSFTLLGILLIVAGAGFLIGALGGLMGGFGGSGKR